MPAPRSGGNDHPDRRRRSTHRRRGRRSRSAPGPASGSQAATPAPTSAISAAHVAIVHGASTRHRRSLRTSPADAGVGSPEVELPGSVVTPTQALPESSTQRPTCDQRISQGRICALHRHVASTTSRDSATSERRVARDDARRMSTLVRRITRLPSASWTSREPARNAENNQPGTAAGLCPGCLGLLTDHAANQWHQEPSAAVAAGHRSFDTNDDFGWRRNRQSSSGSRRRSHPYLVRQGLRAGETARIVDQRGTECVQQVLTQRRGPQTRGRIYPAVMRPPGTRGGAQDGFALPSQALVGVRTLLLMWLYLGSVLLAVAANSCHSRLSGWSGV